MAIERDDAFWEIATHILENHPDGLVRRLCTEELCNRVVDKYLLDTLSFAERQNKAASVLLAAIESSSDGAERAHLEITLRKIREWQDPMGS